MKPVVAIDLSCLESRVETGVERYAARLVEFLPRVAEDLEFVVLVRPGRPAPSVPEPGRIVNVPSPLPRAVWRETAMPRAVRRLGVALLHSPVAAVPLMSPVPRIATIHDVPTRDQSDAPGRRLARNRLRLVHALRAATRIVVPSFATRDALVKVEPRVAPRVDVIPHGVDPDFRPEGLPLDRNRYRFPGRRFLLWVGTIRPRKDPLVLLRAFDELLRDSRFGDLALVMCGDQRMPETALREALHPGHRDRLVLPGYVPRGDLPELYRAAAAMVVPSRLEGFGLPALEALASGVPLVVSEDSALVELTGDAALRFPTGDAASLRERLERVLDDEVLRQEQVSRGLERSQSYSWEGTARSHAEVYRRVLAAAGVGAEGGIRAG